MPSARTAATTESKWPDWVATVGRVAGGKQGALGEFYNAASPLILGPVRRIVEDIPTAEEITLDVYFQIWRLAGNYELDAAHPDYARRATRAAIF